MPIKILIDCHAFDHSVRQGITTYLAGIYREAVKLAPDIDFYFAAQHPDRLKAIFGSAPNIHYLAYRSGNKYWRLAYELPQLIRREKFAYAHFQYISPLTKRCREIVTLHDVLFKDFPDQFSRGYRISKSLLFSHSAKRADLLLTVSEYSRRRIAYFWRIPERQIVVTPNAVDRDWNKISPGAADKWKKGLGVSRYILYVSRIEPRKNHAALLRSYRNLRLWERNIGLVCVGAPALHSAALETEKRLLPAAAQRKIHWLSGIDTAALKELYSGADLFVFPSLAEGFGIPPLEAAMCEIPCLCSNQTAMEEFQFFGNGLFDPKDESALQQKLADFFDGTLILPAKGNIKEQIQSGYSWKYAAQVMLDAICNDQKNHPIRDLQI